jgi:ABC-type transport system involved in multi-copper enzyme maturation permease subunit
VNIGILIYALVALLLVAALVVVRRQIIYGIAHGIPAVYHVAGMTFAETRRRRILQVVILLAALMLVALISVTWLSPGEADKAIITGGLDLLSLLGILMAIFICAFLIPSDIDKRTIYTVLSKPIKRWEFVVGRYFGALGVLGLLVAIMLIVQMIVLLFSQRYLDWQILLAGFMTYFGIAVFAAAVLAISTVASSLTTVIAGFALWMVGSIQSMAHSVIADAEGIRKGLLIVLSSVVPHLSKYSFGGEVAEKHLINFAVIQQAILYGVVYIVVCLIIASLLFNERQV